MKKWYTSKDLQGCAVHNYNMHESNWIIYLNDGRTRLTMGWLNKTGKKKIRKLVIDTLKRDVKYQLQNFELYYDGVN